MKLDKRSVQPIENGNHKRMTKYRRLKNLLKKSMEISLQCNIMINVSVYDLKSHKLQENFTHKGVSLDKINEMRTTQSTIGSGKKTKKLTFKSVCLSEQEVNDNITMLDEFRPTITDLDNEVTESIPVLEEKEPKIAKLDQIIND